MYVGLKNWQPKMEKRGMLYFIFLIFILFMYALCKITSSLSCLLIFVL